MRKRNWILLIISLIIIAAFIFVIILSNKNNKLKYFSDDLRQVTLVKEIYQQILDEKLNEKVILKEDTSIYINFITFNHYVISQENSINALLDSYISNDAKSTYTLDNKFDLKELKLTVTLKKEESLDTSIYTYKLSINKKENKINYKLLKTDHIIE